MKQESALGATEVTTRAATASITRRGRGRVFGLALGCALGLADLALGWQAASAQAPARNLLVSWRVVSSADAQQSRAGVRQGGLVIDSRRGVIGHGGVEVSTRQLERDQQAHQQILVLNGRKARLDLRQQRPITQWQWVAQLGSGGQGGWGGGPQGGQGVQPQVGLVAQTLWVDAGQGLTATPRWSGGKSATVELEAEAPAQPDRPFAQDAQGTPPARLVVQTALSVPLGEWVAVAQTHRQEEVQRRGMLSTQSVSSDDQAVLEIRVSLP
jgi:hypothetical protein